MLTINSDIVKITINERGGTLNSVVDLRTGEELLWQGEERSWKDQDVIIFPFVGRLKDKTYTVDGKPYSMEIHGLLRYQDFKIIRHTADELVLGYSSNAETLKKYPFPFEFILSYKLDGDALSTSFKVDNVGDKTMYFGLGAHPAYVIDCKDDGGEKLDTCGNFIEFNKQRLTYLTLKSSLIDGAADYGEADKIELSKENFTKYDTYIFKDFKGDITLKRRNGRQIRFELNSPPILAFWSHIAYGNYVCIEPWLGLPDYFEATKEMKDKAMINGLDAGESFVYTYKTVY